MLDVHMIPSVGFERGFDDQVARLQHPLIKIQTGKFVEANMLAARSGAYALGTAQYVSWVDPDDEILDISWINDAIELMEADQQVAAVYPRWISTVDGKITYTAPIHEWDPASFNRGTKALGHTFTIMRRSNVLRTLAELKAKTTIFKNRVDVLLVHSQMRYGRCVPEPTIAYNWKLRANSGRHNVNDDATIEISRQYMRETLRIASGSG